MTEFKISSTVSETTLYSKWLTATSKDGALNNVQYHIRCNTMDNPHIITCSLKDRVRTLKRAADQNAEEAGKIRARLTTLSPSFLDKIGIRTKFRNATEYLDVVNNLVKSAKSERALIADALKDLHKQSDELAGAQIISAMANE